MSDDFDRRLRRVEGDVAELKRDRDAAKQREDEMMKSITRHVDLAVKAGIDSGLAPLATIPPRVHALELETAKQTPLIQQTRDAVVAYQAAESVRKENQELARVDYAAKLDRAKLIMGLIATILTVLGAAVAAAISSHH